jgi:hypothetical protein
MHSSNDNLLRIGAAVFLSLAALFFCAVETNAQDGGVKGKVRDQQDRGIAGAVIEIRREGNVVKIARANAKGEFVIRGLQAGKYNVAFDADGYATGVLFGVEVADDVRDLGDRLVLAVDAGTLVMIRGSVFYRDGTSILGAKIELHRVNSDGSVKRVASAITNLSGEFAFRRPPGDGKYRVTAKFKNSTGSSDITVDNPAIYRTAITLDLERERK